MCGIAGFIALPTNEPEQVLGSMLAAMRHRGPDDEAWWSSETTFLGHRRLSIIDVDGGHQPMLTPDGRLAVVFNGEIYNYPELRRDMERSGVAFRTHCDTEILLHLYRRYGTAMTTHLRGMFAFAIWDTENRRLFAARDRMGQKPFYYWHRGHTLVFGSELEALMRCPAIPADKDYGALKLYFQYGHIPPPFTCYCGVRKLGPAEQFTFTDGRIQLHRYWQVEPNPDAHARESELLEELDALVRDCIRIRLASDVPLGAFLSGGLDSSLIVAYMRELCGQQVKTYSIGFKEATWDESPHAKTVADHLRVDHHTRIVRMDGASLLDTLVRHFGEPFGDSSAIPTYYLSQFTRTGVTVALSGDGGDEIFGGYSRYLGRKVLRYYCAVPRVLRNLTVGTLLKLTAEPSVYLQDSRLKMLRRLHGNACLLDDNPDNVAPVIFAPAELRPLWAEVKAEPAANPLLERIERFHGLHPVEQMMYLDAETYLEADLNVKVDRMSMAHSLEVRSPFLDHNIVEFMSRVPLSMKLRGFRQKYLLKKLGEKYLPQRIVHRPKHGFGVPLGDWFRKELVEAWKQTVSPDSLAPLAYEPAEALWNAHQSGRRDHGYHLWHLLVFCLWNRQ